MHDNRHFYWNELLTTDPEAAKEFYGSTIGWSFDSMPMDGGGTYSICMSEDKPCGGIMQLQDTAPGGDTPHWFAYVAVDDLEARLEKAKSMGATIVREPFEVPGIGKIAMVEDPQGARMGWMTPVEQSS